GAAVGSRHDQCLFLGRSARHAGALNGSDAIQSKHRGGFNDDLEYVAKRQDGRCGRIGRVADSAVGTIAVGRATLVLSAQKFLPVAGLSRDSDKRPGEEFSRSKRRSSRLAWRVIRSE